MPMITGIRMIGAARGAQGGSAALLAAALTWQLVAAPGTWPWVVAAAVAPDLPLLAGMGHGGVPGRLRPSAVPAYNALHMYWGPLALAVASAWLGAPARAAAIAWALHIAIDRTLGYGLRTRAGDQRPRP